MNILHTLSIRRKLVLIIMLVSTLALLLACVTFVLYDRMTYKQTMVRNTEVLANAISANVLSALEFGDPQAASETLKALQAEPHIVAACVYNIEDVSFAHYHRQNPDFNAPAREAVGHRFEADRLFLFQPILLDEERIGTIYIEADLEEMALRLQRYIQLALLFVMGALVVSFLMAALLQRMVSSPVHRLAEVMRQVSKKRITVYVLRNRAMTKLASWSMASIKCWGRSKSKMMNYRRLNAN